MRKFILYPILLALPFSACNETCDAVVLADLAFQSGVVSALVNQNTATYEISSTVVNALAKSCSDEGSVQRTNPSVLQQQIFYSSTPDFGTKKVVDTYSFKTPELTGGQTTKDVDEIQFLEDGYYLIERISDFAKQVQERDENNNLSQNNNSRNARTTEIIEIRNGRTSTTGEYIKRIKAYSIKN